MKTEGVSVYKLKRIATESLRNSIRLHLDAILLFENESFPSAFQLSVLSLEEYSKAEWIDHYIWTSETNDGYPDTEFEQIWLKLLYLHTKKQWNFVARDVSGFSPKFVETVRTGQLDDKKQRATYVGLSRLKGKVDTSSRVSVPTRFKRQDAASIISLVNSQLLHVCKTIEDEEFYFEGVHAMDDVFDYKIFMRLYKWPHKSGLKNTGWWKRNRSR